MLIEGVVDRGVYPTEQGAAPDNGAALERREAQGPSQGPARPGTPTPLKTLGSWKLGAMIPADRKAGEGSLASSLAPPGAPSPRFEGTGKTGIRAPRPPENQGAGRRSVGFGGDEIEREKENQAWPTTMPMPVIHSGTRW